VFGPFIFLFFTRQKKSESLKVEEENSLPSSRLFDQTLFALFANGSILSTLEH
jgi:hypothetical protein